MQVVNKSHVAFHQNLSILFYRKGKKAGKDGLAPIYCRVTINGMYDEFSTGEKVGDGQTLPLLPIFLEIIDKYKNDPKCVRLKKLLTVPCNQYYNKHLKLMAQELGWNIKLDTHIARYFFANEVTYNMGVALKTVARLLGQKSIRSAEHYTKTNRVARSESMAMVEAKLFGEGGKLIALTENKSIVPDAKNINDQASTIFGEGKARVIQMFAKQR